MSPSERLSRRSRVRKFIIVVFCFPKNISSLVLNALREWKLLCPKGDLGLVFPNGIGKVESYANLIDRGFGPIQIEGGVTVQREAVDAAGLPVLVTVAKYGLHALRHACASLWIEQGHSSGFSSTNRSAHPPGVRRRVAHRSVRCRRAPGLKA